MALLNGIGTKMNGSAGDWTFCNRLGTTVAKQKVMTKGGSRATEAQRYHRLGWGNMVVFWSATRGCLKGAFNHKRPGQTDFNCFMSSNIGRCDVYLTKEMKLQRGCVVAPYEVSSGRLDPIGVTLHDDGRFATDIFLGEGFAIDGRTTIGEFSRAVVEHNARFRHGDVIFCLAVQQQMEGEVPRVSVKSSALQIDAYCTTPLQGHVDPMVEFASVEGCLGSAGPLYGGMTWIQMQRPGPRSAELMITSSQRLVLSGHLESLHETPDLPYRTDEAYRAAEKSCYRHVR